VIFDFDYTLADSSRGVLECVNHALRNMGLPTARPEDIKKTIGMSLSNTLATLAGRGNEERSEEFSRLFIERADEVMADMTVVLDDVPRVIGQLKDKGFCLGIVSTKFRYRIETILGRAGLLEPFDVIVGGEDVSRHKPDPEGLLMATERLGSLESILYVGDSLSDAEAAKRAGLPFVAVLSGVTPRGAFEGYPIHRILNKLSELIDFL
jgi:phosphoglycolate phosphatase